MTEPKFTKGPWRRDDRDWGDKFQILGTGNDAGVDNDVPVCLVNYNLPNADANVDLIAAAPEMYEFVKFFTTFSGQACLRRLGKAGVEIYDSAVKLCAKARGEEVE